MSTGNFSPTPEALSVTERTRQMLCEVEQLRRNRKAQDLQQQITRLEQQMEPYGAICLVGRPVTDRRLGSGVITAQEQNRITVEYSPGEQKRYVLSSRFRALPEFPESREVIAAFTEYEQLLQTRDRLQRELDRYTAE